MACNILQLLDNASNKMALGDLAAGKCFNMHDAMSALEVMDPQMDTGMKSRATDVESEEEVPPLPNEPSAALLIGLLDDVLCAEHSWYSGYTLAQTVFAVECVQRASEIADLPLRAVMVATARGVAAARSIIMRGDVHEM